MDNSCADWYSYLIIKLTLNSNWTIWKNKLCESFANQGWNQETYALLFKYKDGLLVDYAIKKEKLLLDIRRSIDTGTLVDLIAAGLPGFVLEKINRQAMKDTVDLFNEVRKYEHLVNKNRTGVYRKYENKKIYSKIEERTACKTCERLNKGTRYHPEAACWFKMRDNDTFDRISIRHVNNSVMKQSNIKQNKKLIVTPLIKVKLLINDKLEIYGVYDSGSNVSFINFKLLKLKNKKNSVNEKNLITINGVNKNSGLKKLKIKKFKIEKNVNVYIIDEPNFR